MKKLLNIAIIGTGSAGPVAASLLARQGHKVTLFEKAPQKLPVGAGFLLQPSGMEILEDLGCLQEVLKETSQIDSLFCRTEKGKTLLDLHYNELDRGLFGAGTHRASFLDLLLDQCVKNCVSIHWGKEAISIKTSKDKREIRFQDNSTFSSDLVILCDGAKSNLRKQLPIPHKTSIYPWGALWHMGERTTEFSPTTLWQVVNGTKVLNGFLPTGTNKDLLSLFYSLRLNQYDDFLDTGIHQWKRKILKSVPESESFLSKIETHNQLQLATYYDIKMPHWHCDKAVILGDAAHALSPQLGQGVNLALQDAWTLADSIEHADTLETALYKYSDRRKAHLHFYQFATRWITPFFQSNIPPLGWTRDLAFPIATKSKWIRKQMTLSMAGYKDGIFSNRPIKLRHKI